MSLLQVVIEDYQEGSLAFCKFISANDAGATGSHQSGLYIPKDSWSILFEEPGTKGSNKDHNVKIKWQNDFETDSRFIYYGSGSRNEYRITRFGKGFPFLQEEYVGSLFLLIKMESSIYRAYILDKDEDIEAFLLEVGITATQTNCLIPKNDSVVQVVPDLEQLFERFISTLIEFDFPSTQQISTKAREFFAEVSGNKQRTSDDLLLAWLNTEYSLFRAIENAKYKDIISKPFDTVQDLVDCANTMLNRRKSRAGKSLEHHLGSMFKRHELEFEEQVITEGRKKPDFIFPGALQYRNFEFEQEKLTFLAAKTTCKDRWRQILNEADRIEIKHLFTLQQGISENQLEEMYEHNVRLVVPAPYINSFPSSFRTRILSLNNFITEVKSK